MRRILLALALAAGCSDATDTSPDNVTLVGDYTWAHSDPAFGGLSGLEVAEDGGTLVAIGDRGVLVEARIDRVDGRIAGIAAGPLVLLRGVRGRVLTGRRTDAEGLARAQDGGLFVSFEGSARVATLTPDGVTDNLPASPAFDAMQDNASLEALAVGPDGTLYTLPERSGRIDRPFPLYAFDGTGWRMAGQIPRRGPFLPVGADFGPDGRFYLLERDFTGIGFRSRIRRFDADLDAEETLLTTATGTHDNLEGIGVWRDAAGDIRLTLVSDDNFRFFQRTQVVEYAVTR